MRVTVPGRTIPAHFVRVPEDSLPRVHSEITGPPEAFEFIEGERQDMVRVVKPELVEIETFERIG